MLLPESILGFVLVHRPRRGHFRTLAARAIVVNIGGADAPLSYFAGFRGELALLLVQVNFLSNCSPLLGERHDYPSLSRGRQPGDSRQPRGRA